MFGSGFLKVLVVCFLLSFELRNHNRQRAALMPMMVGMMVRMVAMMCSGHESRPYIIDNWFYTSLSTPCQMAPETSEGL
jgi:hypothetical protein